MANKKTTRKAGTEGEGSSSGSQAGDVLELFHPVTADWFRAVFDRPTSPQVLGWPATARGEHTLILAPTGTGKTLTAFLWCLNRLMLEPAHEGPEACRVIYISPLKALAVDVERNLRSPLAGIVNMARRAGVGVREQRALLIQHVDLGCAADPDAGEDGLQGGQLQLREHDVSALHRL